MRDAFMPTSVLWLVLAAGCSSQSNPEKTFRSQTDNDQKEQEDEGGGGGSADPLPETTPLPGQVTPVPDPEQPAEEQCNPTTASKASVILACLHKHLDTLDVYLLVNIDQNLAEAEKVAQEALGFAFELALLNMDALSASDSVTVKGKLAVLKSTLARVSVAANKSSLASTVLKKVTAAAAVVTTLTSKLG
jgi:hypothetical protein